MPANISLNPDASPAALRAVRSAPVSFVRWASNVAIINRREDWMSKSIAALCLSLGLSQGVHADTDFQKVTIDRPEIKVGDSWVFTRLDGYTGSLLGSETEKITALSEAEITIHSSMYGTIIYNSDWNLIAQVHDGARTGLETFRPSLAFPLAIGKKWKWQADFKNAKGEQLSYKPEAEVIGWEKIAVPAGSFDALRITSSGSYSGTGPRGAFSGTFQQTYWYTPEASRVVKHQFQNSAGTRFTTELSTFQLAPR
jgi:hypothetical protein